MTTQTYSRRKKPTPKPKRSWRTIGFAFVAGVTVALAPTAYQGYSNMYDYYVVEQVASLYPQFPDFSKLQSFVPMTMDEAAACVWRINDGDGSSSIIFCEPLDDGRKIIAGGEEEIELPPRYRVLVLTAEHVIRYLPYGKETPLLSLTNRYGDNILFNGKVVATHPEHDVALLEFVSNAYIKPIHTTTKLPKFGATVWKLGYGGSSGPIWPSKGLYAGGRHVTTYITYGDSGGPVLDDQKRQIGVIVDMRLLRTRNSPFSSIHHEYARMVTMSVIDEWLSATIHFILSPPQPEPEEEESPEQTPDDKSPHTPSPPTGPQSEKPKASETPTPESNKPNIGPKQQ